MPNSNVALHSGSRDGFLYAQINNSTALKPDRQQLKLHAQIDVQDAAGAVSLIQAFERYVGGECADKGDAYPFQCKLFNPVVMASPLLKTFLENFKDIGRDHQSTITEDIEAIKDELILNLQEIVKSLQDEVIGAAITNAMVPIHETLDRFAGAATDTKKNLAELHSLYRASTSAGLTLYLYETYSESDITSIVRNLLDNIGGAESEKHTLKDLFICVDRDPSEKYIEPKDRQVNDNPKAYAKAGRIREQLKGELRVESEISAPGNPKDMLDPVKIEDIPELKTGLDVILLKKELVYLSEVVVKGDFGVYSGLIKLRDEVLVNSSEGAKMSYLDSRLLVDFLRSRVRAPANSGTARSLLGVPVSSPRTVDRRIDQGGAGASYEQGLRDQLSRLVCFAQQSNADAFDPAKDGQAYKDQQIKALNEFIEGNPEAANPTVLMELINLHPRNGPDLLECLMAKSVEVGWGINRSNGEEGDTVFSLALTQKYSTPYKDYFYNYPNDTLRSIIKAGYKVRAKDLGIVLNDKPAEHLGQSGDLFKRTNFSYSTKKLVVKGFLAAGSDLASGANPASKLFEVVHSYELDTHFKALQFVRKKDYVPKTPFRHCFMTKKTGFGLGHEKDKYKIAKYIKSQLEGGSSEKNREMHKIVNLARQIAESKKGEGIGDLKKLDWSGLLPGSDSASEGSEVGGQKSILEGLDSKQKLILAYLMVDKEGKFAPGNNTLKEMCKIVNDSPAASEKDFEI